MDQSKPHRTLDGPISRRPAPSVSHAITSAQVPAASLPARPAFEYKRPKPGNGWKRRVVLAILGTLVAVILFFAVKLLLASHKIISRNSGGGAPALAGNIDPTKLK